MIYPKADIVKALISLVNTATGLIVYTKPDEDSIYPLCYIENIEISDESPKTGDICTADITLHIIDKSIDDISTIWAKANNVVSALNRLGSLEMDSHTSIGTVLIGTSQQERMVNEITYNYEIIRFVETIKI